MSVCNRCGENKKKTYHVKLIKEEGYYCEVCLFELEDILVVDLMAVREALDLISIQKKSIKNIY